MGPSDRIVRLGFVPLLDAAIPIVAHALGFDEAEGLTFSLQREVSWANVRDKLLVGHLHAAHILAPMSLASTLGIGHVQVPMVAPMALGLNGNAITIAEGVAVAMAEADPDAMAKGGMAAGRALAKVVAARARAGAEPLALGMVHPFSCHNYALRQWLSVAGIDPDTDVRLVVIPPPLIVASLEAGHIHGFCVGAPWNTFAVEQGLGQIVATQAELWPASPEKVLGVTTAYAEADPDRLARVIRALRRAALWLETAEGRADAAQILAHRDYLDAPAASLARILAGQIQRRAGGPARAEPYYLRFGDGQINRPEPAHARWIVSAMVRWGQAPVDVDVTRLVSLVYRPDLYNAALGDREPVVAAPASLFADAPFFAGQPPVDA